MIACQGFKRSWFDEDKDGDGRLLAVQAMLFWKACRLEKAPARLVRGEFLRALRSAGACPTAIDFEELCGWAGAGIFKGLRPSAWRDGGVSRLSAGPGGE